MPRGIDREMVEALHRTHIGDDQDPVHLLQHAVKTAMADGWGGSMIATDVADILFGTPAPVVGQANLGVLKADMVNVVVHGHEPILSEMIVAASQTPEIIEYAKAAGANGVNLAGICCTANEILMRQGIPAAGNFLHQELAILTGAVEAMVVDVQCIMQALVGLAENFHTKVITTSPKVKIKGATHIEFDEHHAMTIAKDILKVAIDNFKNRGTIEIPQVVEDLIPGFSHEYINYMLGGSYRASFRPLNDAIMSRPHSRRGGDRGLQQSAQPAGLSAHARHARTAQAGRARRRDGLRRDCVARSWACCSAKRVSIKSAPACAKSARRWAFRRCCTWARAWTTRASSPC